MRRRTRHSRPLAVTTACLVGAIVLAACGSESDTTGAPAAPAPAAEGPTASNAAPAAGATVTEATGPGTPAAAVPDALAFSAPLVGGGTLDLGSLAGKPVVMWFWAPF